MFIDRDGTLISEPPIDYQVDSLEKLELMPGALRAMHFIASRLPYKLVMVTLRWLCVCIPEVWLQSCPMTGLRHLPYHQVRRLCCRWMTVCVQRLSTSEDVRGSYGMRSFTANASATMTGLRHLPYHQVRRLLSRQAVRRSARGAVWLLRQGCGQVWRR